MRRFTLLLVTLALMAGACGDGDDASDEQSLSVAIRIRAADNPENPLDESATTCLADGVVDEFGVETLANLGVTPENPNFDRGRVFETREQAERAFDLFFDCVNIDRDLLPFLPERLEIAEDSIRCLGQGLNSDTFKELFVSVVLGESESARVIDDPAASVPIGELAVECLQADELLQMTQLGG